MYRLHCNDPEIEKTVVNHPVSIQAYVRTCTLIMRHWFSFYRKAREIKGVKKILIGSGLRYDLAVLNPEYVKELVQHHVGGYLKIAPEHTEQGHFQDDETWNWYL